MALFRQDESTVRWGEILDPQLPHIDEGRVTEEEVLRFPDAIDIAIDDDGRAHAVLTDSASGGTAYYSTFTPRQPEAHPIELGNEIIDLVRHRTARWLPFDERAAKIRVGVADRSPFAIYVREDRLTWRDLTDLEAVRSVPVAPDAELGHCLEPFDMTVGPRGTIHVVYATVQGPDTSTLAYAQIREGVVGERAQLDDAIAFCDPQIARRSDGTVVVAAAAQMRSPHTGDVEAELKIYLPQNPEAGGQVLVSSDVPTPALELLIDHRDRPRLFAQAQRGIILLTPTALAAESATPLSTAATHAATDLQAMRDDAGSVHLLFREPDAGWIYQRDRGAPIPVLPDSPAAPAAQLVVTPDGAAWIVHSHDEAPVVALIAAQGLGVPVALGGEAFSPLAAEADGDNHLHIVGLMSGLDGPLGMGLGHSIVEPDGQTTSHIYTLHDLQAASDAA